MMKRPDLRIPAPRLLPLTIAAMLLLLLVKTTGLVRAALLPSAEQRALSAVEQSVVTAAHAATPPGPAGAPSATTPGAPQAVESEGATKVTVPAEPPVSAAERALLLDLRQRKKILDQREAALAAREAALDAAERRIAGRVDELKTLEQRLIALDAERKQHQESSWAGLVKLYETMRPRDAATIFNDLDMNVVLPVVDRMKEAKAAAILAAMQPEKARQITTQLAAMRTHETGGG
jgi:flagellar motility protein MotE (MotC chaperone)